MDNPSFIYDNFNCSKIIDAEEKLLLKKLNEAFATKNLEKFKMLLQRPIRKALSRLNSDGHEIPEIKTTPTVFQRFNLFRNFSFRFQSGIDISNANYSQKFAYNELLSQKILCYRKAANDLTLLEKIMREPESGEFIAFVWNDCDFWRDAFPLTTVNEQGKLLMDFIIESGDNGNLFVFLIHDLKDRGVDSNSSDKNYFLKLKNDQFMRKSGISLFCKIYAIASDNAAKAGQCLVILEEMLKEMKQIIDIRREVRVDTVLAMSGEIQDDILKLLVKYWRVNSKDYHYYRNAFCEVSPFFRLYLALKEHDEDEFEDSFCEYLDYMRHHYRDDFNEKLQEDSNLLLTFALNHGLKKAMQILIKCYSVDVNKLSDSSDVSINNEYAMLKLLEKGYYLGYEDEEINKDGNWINAKVFEQFLDSRVTTMNGNASSVNRDDNRGIQIDYTFLISPEIRPITMNKDENGQRLIFNPGMAPLEWLLTNEKLRHLITHPVLSTFINLKSHKFSQIYSLNLYMFCMFYVFPFMLVFVSYDPQDETDMLKILIPAATATFYLTIREAIQFFWIIEDKLEYFKKKSNKLEMLMIISSWWLVIALVTHKYHSYQVSSAFIILFGAIELLSILPYSSLSIYMFMLKEVTITFLKFFTIFMLIILAFTFSFYAILKPIKHVHEKNVYKNFNETVIATSGEAVFKNFEHPFTSFIKTILMFAGDFSVDPYKLDSFWKQILFLCFVLTAFILYNLINGLAISDIQKLKDDAEFLNLKQRIRTTVDCEKISCNLFWKLCGSKKTEKTNSFKDVEKNLTTDKDLNCIERTTKNILIFMVNRYVFLHKMDNLFIDLKHKSIFYKINQRREPILRKMTGTVKSYSLDDECYERLVAILKRKDKSGEDVTEKVAAIENDVKMLVEQMEIVKKLMQDIAAKFNAE